MSGVEIQPLLAGSASPAGAESSGQHSHNQPPPQPKVDNVWKACAYGDFDTLRTLLNQDSSLVNQGDEQVLPATQN